MPDEQVHLLAELPQMLAAEGVPLADAERRVHQLQQDVRCIIGGPHHQDGPPAICLPGAEAWPASLVLRRAVAVSGGGRLRAGECLQCVASELDFSTLPNCWEHFGFDLLVDDAWQPWLLEANAEPDFRQGLLEPTPAPCVSCGGASL